MSKTMQAEAEVEVERPPAVDPEPVDESKTKRQPPYAVILHNDDVNGFDFVIGAIRKVFHYGVAKAFRLTLAAHLHGRSVVWSGMLEVAELKADQLRSCGADPKMKSAGALPLRVTVEPLPGK